MELPLFLTRGVVSDAGAEAMMGDEKVYDLPEDHKQNREDHRSRPVVLIAQKRFG
jgi:hypothetical protein